MKRSSQTIFDQGITNDSIKQFQDALRKNLVPEDKITQLTDALKNAKPPTQQNSPAQPNTPVAPSEPKPTTTQMDISQVLKPMGGSMKVSLASLEKKISQSQYASNVTKEQLMETFGIDEDLAEELEAILDSTSFDDDAAYKALQDIDHLLNENHSKKMTHGVEGIMGEHSDRSIYYLNTGDTYTSTIIYDDEEGFYIGDWGTWIEEVDDKAKYENEIEMAENEMGSIISDIESGYLEGYDFVDPNTVPDEKILGKKYFSYLWDNYVSIGEAENVGDIVDDSKKALEFLKEENLIKEVPIVEE